MVKCDKCLREFKNPSGLRLHMRSHKNDIEEKKVDTQKTIELYHKDTGVLVISYTITGEKELEEAKKNAFNRNFRIEIT